MKFALKGLKLHVMTVAVLMVTFSELYLQHPVRRVQCYNVTMYMGGQRRE